MRRWLIACAMGFVTAVIGVGIVWSPLGEDIENYVGLPWLFSIRGPVEAPAEMAVVGINEGSGRRMGLPNVPRDWPRSIHGTLIQKLTQAGASVIVFDMAFTLAKSSEHDLAFAKAVAESKRMVLFQLLTGKRQAVTDRAGRNTGWVCVEQLVAPIPPLAAAALATLPACAVLSSAIKRGSAP